MEGWNKRQPPAPSDPMPCEVLLVLHERLLNQNTLAHRSAATALAFSFDVQPSEVTGARATAVARPSAGRYPHWGL
eukprot:4959181-Lingulodinium_polyedra.AAC.1